jgi:UDP-N-acetylglucosamine 2-epimerase (non-hydrolysing)
MKIMTVVGARPNFMKAAPIIAAINQHNRREVAAPASNGRGLNPDQQIQHSLVHTGQHYDAMMSDSFFADLNLPAPDIHLGVGSGSHAAQTAEIMRKFEPALLKESPDALILVGDVNSTVACALVAAKISFNANETRPLIVHVEAGLRSFDRTMPEEINRILTDHLSDLLFVTEESGWRNLAAEGIPAGRVHFVGNTMIDSLLACREKAEASTVLDDLGLHNNGAKTGRDHSVARYALLTLHRPGNVDSREVFVNILQSLEEIPAEYEIVFPAHPRTQKRIVEFGLEHHFEWNGSHRESSRRGAHSVCRPIRITEPRGYLDFLCLMDNAALVVTDSGGIQEETTCLGVPCVTVRQNTERPVTVSVGTNVLAGVTREGIGQAIRRQLNSKQSGHIPELWDGKSAERIVQIISQEFRERDASLDEDRSAVSYRPDSTAEAAELVEAMVTADEKRNGSSSPAFGASSMPDLVETTGVYGH